MSFFMRHLQFCWRTLVLSTQQNPPESIEHLMVLLTLALGLNWVFQPDWQYLVLSSSFAIGAAASMWVREAIVPSPRPRMVMIVAITVLLLYSVYAFANVAYDVAIT
jgi:hypothetical protein